MHHLLSTSNLWILAAGGAVVVFNALASSRLAPVLARLFVRIGGHAELPPPSRRSA